MKITFENKSEFINLLELKPNETFFEAENGVCVIVDDCYLIDCWGGICVMRLDDSKLIIMDSYTKVTRVEVEIVVE